MKYTAFTVLKNALSRIGLVAAAFAALMLICAVSEGTISVAAAALSGTGLLAGCNVLCGLLFPTHDIPKEQVDSLCAVKSTHRHLPWHTPHHRRAA